MGHDGRVTLNLPFTAKAMSCSTKDCLSCKMIDAIRNPLPGEDMLVHIPTRLPDGTVYHYIHPGVDAFAANIFLAAALGYKPEQVFCHDHYQHFLHMQQLSPEAQRQAALKK